MNDKDVTYMRTYVAATIDQTVQVFPLEDRVLPYSSPAATKPGMMLPWVRQRLLNGGYFLRDLLSVIFYPTKVVRRLDLDDEHSFDRALTFGWQSIKLGILFSMAVSAMTHIELSELLWYGVRILEFLLIGVIICGVLLVLGERKATFDNVYHVFAYPFGVVVLLSSFMGSLLLIYGQTASGRLFFGVDWHRETFADGLSRLQIGLPTLLLIVSALWCFSLFSYALRSKLGIPLWKTSLSILVAIPTVMLLSATVMQVELNYGPEIYRSLMDTVASAGGFFATARQ